MSEIDKAKTMELLKKQGFFFKKKWGQNFLFDTNLLKKIVAGAEIVRGDSVVEIGPGAGTLTRVLAEAGANVLAIEIDRSLIPFLENSLQRLEVKIIQGDILKVNLDQLIEENKFTKPYKVVANLPYYITTPIIMDLLEKKYHLDLMVFMVQWEVAQRLTAKPGGKEYGAITLAIEYHTEAKILFKVPRTLFHPVPEVDSAIVSFQKRQKPKVFVYNEALLFTLIKAAFGMRRKTLFNALKSVNPPLAKEEILTIFKKVNIDEKRRGETLTLQEFASIANCWWECSQKHGK